MTPSHYVDTFMRHGLPGMTLLAPKRYHGETVRRCACGVPISRDKQACLSCLVAELGPQIESQEVLDAVIARNFPGMRERILGMIRPFLSFEPK